MPDRQRVAFTEADPADHAALSAFVGAEHAPGDLDGVRTPDEWDAEDWDVDRQPAKNLRDAQAALAARIADPDAPDDEDTAHAYDDAERGR